LLKRFVQDREIAALEELVHRHAPMVLGVCRRILENSHDAEDAFQATFLIMVRRAAAIRKPDAVGAWLYAVARQTAIRSRKARRRRDQFQVQTGPAMDQAPGGENSEEAEWRELRPVLDEELGRLPEKYRAPVVLCYLEGRSNTEAAEQLGWPIGTVKGRLARARLLLQNRLTRRGVALGAALIATSAATRAALASDVPQELTRATIQEALRVAGGSAPSSAAVTTLFNAGLRATLSKAQLIGAVVGLLGLCALSVVVVHYVIAGRGPGPATRHTIPWEQIYREANTGRTEPAGVRLTAQVVGARDFYTLDLGGLLAEEFRKRLGYGPQRPGVGGGALPPSPEVGLRLEMTNTGKEEVRIRVRGDSNKLTIDLKGPGAVYASLTGMVVAPIRREPEILVVAPGQTVVVADTATLAFPKPDVGSQAYWTAPGEYRLTVSYLVDLSPAPDKAPYAGGGFGQVTVHSAPITLKVVEAN
jgi:RNA polymerase sigma factor (sigma-70 family)